MAETAFVQIPSEELHIRQEPVLGGLITKVVAGSQGEIPNPFTHRLMPQMPTQANGSTMRIVDSRNTPASKTIAAAFFAANPGAMCEMHWYPNADEWQ